MALVVLKLFTVDLGNSGTGIRLLTGLLTPDSGTINILGLQLPREAETLRSRIGYMTQKFSLYEDLTVRENLQFLAQIYALPRQQRQPRISAQLERFELAQRTDQIAGTLSGGQRQRLALAAATLHEPELLFLDEPTSAVDPESRRQFWDHLFEMVDRGTTILVSTHFMDEAERCHRLAILDEGRLVVSGVPDELMDSLGATVIEISSTRSRRIREALLRLDAVWHVAQLGNRLHALVAPDLRDPEDHLTRVVATLDPEALVRRVRANLEDVFVMATSEPH